MSAKRWLIAGSALTAAGILGSGYALAAAGSDSAPQLTVRYADLDLNTEDGAAKLLRRINFAATRVCPEASHDLRLAALARECRAAATARAVEQVHSVRLTALHATKAGAG
jgi:UrcA family protein